MLVVIPVCQKDAAICLQNLDWVARLDKTPYPYTAAVTHDSDFDATAVIAKAKERFASVLQFTYPPWRGQPQWPYPQNWAWQQTARWVEKAPKENWLWWEQDAVPVRKGWLDDIVKEYAKAKMPFMGHLVDDYDGHMNGVGCYPYNISKYTTDALICRAVAFDLILRPAIIGKVQKANHLFQHRAGYEPDTFSSYQEVLGVVTKECALFHRCKDGSLVDRLLEGPSSSYKRTPPRIAGNTVCFHSGDYGDIVYSLLFVKKCLKSVDFFCGPENESGTRLEMSEERFRWIEPLLKSQPYIKSVSFSNNVPPKATHNLNKFRKMWLNWELRSKSGVDCLFKTYPFVFGFEPLPENEAWLTSTPNPIPAFPVLVHRSKRYRNDHFPWHRVLKKYAERIAFIGMKSEWEEFCARYSRLPFLDVTDASDMAGAIAGCRLFVGNQSFPMSLALGLGKPAIQEVSPQTPDCIFRRDSLICFRPGDDPGALPLPDV